MFSTTGTRLAARSGILDLMDDLGRAMTTDPDMKMLGGGNPAHIPAVDAVWRRRMTELMADGDALERMLGPMPVTPLAQGVRATAELFRARLAAGSLDPEANGLPAATPA